MNNKNYYKKASFLSAIICFCLCIALLILFVRDMKSNIVETPWILLFISIVIGCIGVYFLITTIRFRIMCNHIKRNGVSHRGTVIDVRKSIKTSDEAGSSSYSFLVEFYSTQNGKTIRFWTPYTSFVPHNNHITCVVHELHNQYYVDGFE